MQFKLEAYKHQITRNIELEGKQSICHLIDDLRGFIQDALFPGRISGLKKKIIIKKSKKNQRNHRDVSTATTQVAGSVCVSMCVCVTLRLSSDSVTPIDRGRCGSDS